MVLKEHGVLEEQYGWSVEFTWQVVRAESGEEEMVQLKKRKLKFFMQTESRKKVNSKTLRKLTR